jgi:hypothetical protein
LTVVMIVVAVFVVAALSIMIKAESRSTERREINPLGPSPKKRRSQTVDGTYILK